MVIALCLFLLILDISGLFEQGKSLGYKKRDNIHINILAIAYYCKINGIDSDIALRHFFIENYFLHVTKKGGIQTSHKGAKGIGQLMPNTAAFYEVDPDIKLENIRGSVECLTDLMRYYKNKRLAISAYNAGIPRVNRHKRKGTNLPRETVHHWRKIKRVNMDKIISFAREYDGV